MLKHDCTPQSKALNGSIDLILAKIYQPGACARPALREFKAACDPGFLRRKRLLVIFTIETALAQAPVDLDNENFTQHLNSTTTGGYYRLIEDIDLSQSVNGDQRNPWNPVGTSGAPFTGELDGNGHIIRGLNITSLRDLTPSGLFGYITDSWVHHLYFERPQVLTSGGGSHTGTAAGEALRSNITFIINNLGMVRAEQRSTINEVSAAGGIVGIARGNSHISDNINSGVVTLTGGISYLGGIVGHVNDGSIVSHSFNHGAISAVGGHTFAGGISGSVNNGSVARHNLNTGAVTTDGEEAYCGGITGLIKDGSQSIGNLNTGMVESLIGITTGPGDGNLNTGMVESLSGTIGSGDISHAGGVNGYAVNNVEISNNLNAGRVHSSGNNTETGGIVGDANNNVEITSNLNAGEISTDGVSADAGGIIGNAVNYAKVRNNRNLVEVSTTGNSSAVGGISGHVSVAEVFDNINSGRIGSEGGKAGSGGIIGSSTESGFSGNLNTGQVSSLGGDSDVSGITGSSTYSVFNGNLNTGQVSALGVSSQSGGIAGWISRCRATNNLNYGSFSGNGGLGHTGGICGHSHDSIIGLNLNRGSGNGGSAGHTIITGGIMGHAFRGGVIRNNVNSGAITTMGEEAYTGGITGQPREDTSALFNLNTGPVRSTGNFAHAGGINGRMRKNSQVSSNLNTGSVTSTGSEAHTSGVTGYHYDNSVVSYNLNAGPVSSSGNNSHTGGVSGFARSKETVVYNINTGPVQATGYGAAVGGKVARAVYSTVHSNQNSGPVTSVNGTEYFEPIANVTGVFHSLLDQILSGPALSLRAHCINWFSGIAPVYPALLDLRRISGAGNNTYPEVLNQLIIPTGDASLFDREFWNIKAGYLPFPKIFARAATVTDINCEPGGFACYVDEDVSTPPTAAPDSCPVPKGTPVFQAYDHRNQRFYVVRHNRCEQDFSVIRYKNRALDEQFGNCGVQTIQTSETLLPTGYEITAGALQHKDDGIHLYLATTTDLSTVMLDLTLVDERFQWQGYEQPEQFYTRYNQMVSDGNRWFLTGVSRVLNVALGQFENQQLTDLSNTIEKEDLTIQESGQGLALASDREHVFITGMNNNDIFLRKYQLPSFSPDSRFAEGGKQIVMSNTDKDSRPSVLVHQGLVYVAISTDNDRQLQIQRFNPESGEQDNSFIISRATPEFSAPVPTYRMVPEFRPARVHLLSDGNNLRLLKYDTHGHIYGASFDINSDGTVAIVYEEHIELSDATDIADHGLAYTDNAAFLAYQKTNTSLDANGGELSIAEIPLPVSVSDPDSELNLGIVIGVPVWVSVTVLTAAVVAVVGAVVYLRYRNSRSFYNPRFKEMKSTR